jgi:hypothetical protein
VKGAYVGDLMTMPCGHVGVMLVLLDFYMNHRVGETMTLAHGICVTILVLTWVT